MATYTEQIHKAITETMEGGAFHPFRYSGRVLTVDDSSSVAPATVLVYEVSSFFGTPVRHRMSRRQERLGWEWLAVLEFQVGVSCERFEEDLCTSQILIPRSAGLRQVTLKLSGSEYDHPARQQASKGTVASFRFDAELSPV